MGQSKRQVQKKSPGQVRPPCQDSTHPLPSPGRMASSPQQRFFLPSSIARAGLRTRGRTDRGAAGDPGRRASGRAGRVRECGAALCCAPRDGRRRPRAPRRRWLAEPEAAAGTRVRPPATSRRRRPAGAAPRARGGRGGGGGRPTLAGGVERQRRRRRPAALGRLPVALSPSATLFPSLEEKSEGRAGSLARSRAFPLPRSAAPGGASPAQAVPPGPQCARPRGSAGSPRGWGARWSVSEGAPRGLGGGAESSLSHWPVRVLGATCPIQRL